MKIVKLIPPDLSLDNIKENITCIRSHRERIFRIDTELLNNKIIVHNYGHGGAGWTFLFGAVEESIKQFQEKYPAFAKASADTYSVCVIGAGCYGLLTALTLYEMGYKVRIVAEKTEDLQSDKAAGFFFPRHRKCSNPQEIAIFRSIGLSSYKQYLSIINGTHKFIKRGPILVPAYFSLDIDPGFEPYIEQNLIDKPEHVMIDFGNNKKYLAQEYKIIFINPSVLMQELRQEVKTRNISIENKKISDFSEICENIIFNCSGQQAKFLTKDPKLVPVQGHLITLKNPNLNNLYLINFKVTDKLPDGRLRDELIYYAPKNAGILGITFIRGQDDPNSNSHEFDRLLKRSQEFF